MLGLRKSSVRYFAVPTALTFALVVWVGCGGSSFPLNGSGGTTAGTTTAGTTTAGTTTAGTTTAGTTTAGTTTAGTTTAGTTTAGTTTAGTTTGSSAACSTGFSPNYIGQFTPRTFNHMPIKVFVNGDLTVSSTVPGQANMDYAALALAGCEEWTAAVGNAISFTQVSSAAQADVVINFATITDPSAPVAWNEKFLFTGNTITSATVTLSAQTSGAAISPDLLQLMGAESFGAALGLGESSNPTDLESANPTVTQPSQADINTLKTLYCSFF